MTLKSGLATKLLRTAFGIYLFFAILITLFQLILEFGHEENLVNKEINDLLKTFKPYIARALWEVDFPHVESAMKGIIKHESVIGVYIEDDEHEPLPALGIIQNDKGEIDQENMNDKMIPHFPMINKMLYSYHFTLHYSDEHNENEIVGYGKIFSSATIVLNRVKYSLILTVINAVIKTSLLWIIFFFSIRFFVSNPLKKLTQTIETFDPEKMETLANEFKLSKTLATSNDELALFIKQFDKMRQAIIKKDFQLTETNKHLENIVSGRTKELKKTCDQLESALQIKGEFLANMSHEIRTPMNGINGMITLLMESEGLTPVQREYTELAKESIDSLLRIINDILDFSKIEAGKLDVEHIEFDLYHLLNSIQKMFSFKIKTKQLDFIWSIDQKLPPKVCGDAIRLKQIIINLIENAIKFTDKGYVKVEIALLNENPVSATIQFSVQDTGIGISEEDQQNLFQSFTQADSSITRKYGGTGLGLTISKQLAKLMNGRIEVESNKGQGSQFKLICNFLKSHTSKEESTGISKPIIQSPITPGQKKKLKILLAEDNPINQAVAKAILKNHGFDANIVVNGHGVLKELKQTPYDIILMDIQMPELDGIETTKLIRENHDKKIASIPIVALTAHSIKGDRERFLSAGINDYISKPIQPEELIKVLEKYLTQKLQSTS